MKPKPTYQELERELEIQKIMNNSNLLLDIAGVIFVELDANGTVILVNKKACEVFGYGENEMLGKNWFENFLPERIKKEIIPISKKILAGEIETEKYHENLILTKSGEERLIYWHNATIRNKNGNIIGHLSSGEDITDRKKAEQTLKENEQNLYESNAEKDKFFSIIAHDLKSPFNSMLGFSELLIENFDKYDISRQKKYISLINQSLRNTHKLLENLLLWSRAQRGIVDFVLKKENLYVLSDETIELLSHAAKNKSITLTNQIPKDIYVEVDKNMLSTIIRNLISNAIKFTPKGGEITTKARTITDENKQNYVEISVNDNGVGISLENQSKIFEITESVSTEGTENEQGTGLGLILCKDFVEKHGGKIWIKSEVGKGSKVIFTLKTTYVA